VIRVEKGWDAKQARSTPERGRSPPGAGRRDHLAEHLMECDRHGDEFVFGRTPASPFDPSTVQSRADKGWSAAGLERVTPHECRHAFASLMIAASVNAKALSTFMGHSTISRSRWTLRAPDARLRSRGSGVAGFLRHGAARERYRRGSSGRHWRNYWRIPGAQRLKAA
jgi:integrase